MRKIFALLLIVSAVALAGCAKQSPRVVMIALDGLSVAGFLEADTPNLDALMAEGALSLTTRDVMPSVTLPNWTSILTGSGPEQHGIVDNSWETDKFILPPVAADADGFYPSLFTILKSELPDSKTAFYYNWINLFYPHNSNYFDEVIYLEEDGYIPYFERAFDFIVENREAPTAVMLYTVHIDHAGHRNRWMSPEYIQAIEEADVQIGIFLDKMKAEGLYDGTHFLMLSDHGGINNGHGGYTVDEMVVPWGITGPGIKKGLKIERPNNTINTASLVLRLFGLEQPDVWIGRVPEYIFE